MKLVIGGGTALVGLLIASSVFVIAKPLNAAVPTQDPIQSTIQTKQDPATKAATEPTATEEIKKATEAETEPAKNAITVETAHREGESYSATAYALPGRTASGLKVGKGIIAADPRVLPLGTRVMISAGNYSGEYIVADTGTAIKGRKLDIWMPSYREACRWGRRTVKLTVISYPERVKRGRNLVRIKPIPVTPKLAPTATSPSPVTEAKRERIAQ